MATFVKAPPIPESSALGISFNNDFFFHTASSSTPATLSSISINGVSDHQLVWFGLAIGGNTNLIQSTTFATTIDNTGMLEAFSNSAQGVDWDLNLSRSTTKNNVPSTDSRLGAIIETDYATFNFLTASTMSEAYKEIWTGGKLANDTTDAVYDDYEHNFTLNFATSTMGTEGHIFNDDVTNVLFLTFWGPGRYVKEVAKRFQIRPTNNTDTEFVLQACVRTETEDTAYSDTARLRETLTGIPSTGGSTFFYNQGDDDAWITSDVKDTSTDMIDSVVYPHTSLVQLSYPRGQKLEDKDDDTTFGFIYQGKKIRTLEANGTIGTSDIFSNSTAEVAYDFISNKRYGLGESFPTLDNSTSAAVFDPQTNYLRHMLRDAKVRCAEQLDVEDSNGTITSQNRYTFNSVLDQPADKLQTLAKILNNMHAQYYFHNGFLKIYQDRPEKPVKVVNQSNCREFKITGRNRSPEFNAVTTKFNNERKMFKQDTTFAELRDQHNLGMPLVSKEVVMDGITNKEQARRHSTYVVETERVNNEYIEYGAGADHAYIKPGDLIYVDHTEDNGGRASGRIKSIEGGIVSLFDRLDFDPGSTSTDGESRVDVYIDNGIDESDELRPYAQNITDNQVYVTGGNIQQNILDVPAGQPLSAGTPKVEIRLDNMAGLKDIHNDESTTAHQGQVINIVQRLNTIGGVNTQPKIYRVVSITETDILQYSIVAERYNTNEFKNTTTAGIKRNKFESIDAGARTPSFEFTPVDIVDRPRINSPSDPIVGSQVIQPTIKNWIQSANHVDGSIKISVISTVDKYIRLGAGGSVTSQGTATVESAEVRNAGDNRWEDKTGYTSSSLSGNDFTINFSSNSATNTDGQVDLEDICKNTLLRVSQDADEYYNIGSEMSGSLRNYDINQVSRDLRVILTANIQFGPDSGNLTWANSAVSSIVQVSDTDEGLFAGDNSNLGNYVTLRQNSAGVAIPSTIKSDGKIMDVRGAFSAITSTYEVEIKLPQPNYDTGLLGPRGTSLTSDIEYIWPSVEYINGLPSNLTRLTGSTTNPAANTTNTNVIKISGSSDAGTPPRAINLRLSKGNNNTVVVSDPQLCPDFAIATGLNSWPYHHCRLGAGDTFSLPSHYTYVMINGVLVRLATFNGTTYDYGDTRGSASLDSQATATDIATDINAANIPNITAKAIDGPEKIVNSVGTTFKLLQIENTAGGPIIFDDATGKLASDGNYTSTDNQGLKMLTPDPDPTTGSTAYGSGTPTSFSAFGMRRTTLRAKPSEHIITVLIDFT